MGPKKTGRTFLYTQKCGRQAGSCYCLEALHGYLRIEVSLWGLKNVKFFSKVIFFYLKKTAIRNQVEGA
jgi:hypothetical protein